MSARSGDSPLEPSPHPPDQQKQGPAVPRLTLRKKIVFALVLLAGLGTAAEVVARVGFFFVRGLDPFYLTYGFGRVYDKPSDRKAGYFKFHPHTTVRQTVAGRIIPMRINNLGLRGPDAPPDKPPDTFRVVTLGGSSTFGYYVEDGQEYPRVLERLLQDLYPGLRIEVINAAIPTFQSSHILELTRKEIFALRPDLITFYEGCNDANHPRDEEELGLATRAKFWLHHHSALYLASSGLLRRAYNALVRRAGRDVLFGGEHLMLAYSVPKAEAEPIRESIRRKFRANLDALIRLTRGNGVPIVLARQAYTTHFAEEEVRGEQAGRLGTYADELAEVRREYDASGALPATRLTMLCHADLMEIVEDLARRHDLPLADGIAAVDRDRSQMLSYVHLSPPANEWVAQAFLDTIVRSGIIDRAAASDAR